MNKNIIKNILKNVLFIIITLSVSTVISIVFSKLVPDSLVNISLIYILCLIVISRYTSGYIYGVISSLICVILVNYCFTYPYFALNFTLTGYPVTFLAMLSISLITSTTTSHMIKQSQIIAVREKQLMEADKEKMRANLLRAVSHDLRTPLTSIIGTLSSYRENEKEYSEAEKETLIHNIYDDSNWLLTMVENLLSVTRIQSNPATLKKSLEAVEEVISESVSRLCKRLPDIDINVNVPDNFIMIPMDAMLIEQVIMNLLENAYIHSESKLPISLTVTETNELVNFHVRDFGIGIDNNKIEAIFDGIPSTVAHTADSKRGMGIGLSICKTIILSHHGTIYAKNHENGAEFVFSLPKEDKND